MQDEVGGPGSGPVASFAGFRRRDVSVAIVPSTVLVNADGTTFSHHDWCRADAEPWPAVPSRRGTVRRGPAMAIPRAAMVPMRSPGRVIYADADLSVAGFTTAVTAAAARIRAGELHKVVLAHDLEAARPRPSTSVILLGRLAGSYPDCWTFAVEGLIGASPVLLIRRTGRESRPGCWPVRRGEHGGDAVSAELLGSAKDIAKHAYAVQSVADVLDQGDRRPGRSGRAGTT